MELFIKSFTITLTVFLIIINSHDISKICPYINILHEI